MRRIASATARMAQCRAYTAPAEAVKLYESNFTTGPFPVDFVTSDAVLYAQFLYKLSGDNGQYTKDFDTLKGLKLPVFWQRNTDVTEIAEITKACSANFVFALRWIQVSGDLESLESVRGYYETYVNAQKKKLIATVYTAPGAEKDTKLQADAKNLVQETLKSHPALKAKASWTVDFKFAVDKTITEGFYAEFGGVSVTTIAQKKGDEAKAATGEVDYTAVETVKKVLSTVWDDNVETDVLRKYFDNLAKLDAEEQAIGV